MPFVYAQNLSADEISALSGFLKVYEQSRINELFYKEYLLRDIDSDGKFEVIEISNEVETNYPGLLDIELFQIFEYHVVYHFDEKTKSYKSDPARFGFYYKSRKIFHEVWLNEILNSTTLEAKNKAIIQSNQGYFVKEIKKIIKKLSEY